MFHILNLIYFHTPKSRIDLFNSIVKVELPANPHLTKLNLSGASDIEGEVNAEELTINLANATITLSPGVTSGASRGIPGIGEKK